MSYTSLERFARRKPARQDEAPSIFSTNNTPRESGTHPENKTLTGDEIIHMPDMAEEDRSRQVVKTYSNSGQDKNLKYTPQVGGSGGIPHVKAVPKVNPIKSEESVNRVPEKSNEAKDTSYRQEMQPQDKDFDHRDDDPEMERFLSGPAKNNTLATGNSGFFQGSNPIHKKNAGGLPVLPEGWYVDAICISITVIALIEIIVNWDAVQRAILSALFNLTDIALVILVLVGLVMIGYRMIFRGRKRK